MIHESFPAPFLAAAILTLVSLVVIPVIAAIEGREKPTQRAPSTGAGGAACAIPPAIDIAFGGAGTEVPPLKEPGTAGDLETATFALG